LIAAGPIAANLVTVFPTGMWKWMRADWKKEAVGWSPTDSRTCAML